MSTLVRILDGPFRLLVNDQEILAAGETIKLTVTSNPTGRDRVSLVRVYAGEGRSSKQLGTRAKRGRKAKRGKS